MSFDSPQNHYNIKLFLVVVEEAMPKNESHKQTESLSDADRQVLSRSKNDEELKNNIMQVIQSKGYQVNAVIDYTSHLAQVQAEEDDYEGVPEDFITGQEIE